jgi:hypothetical protein
MRGLLLVVSLLLSTACLAAGEEFKGSCAYGLSELGVDVKTDCSIRWSDPATGKVYCFGNEQVMMSFLKDPAKNVHKAEQTYAKLYSK